MLNIKTNMNLTKPVITNNELLRMNKHKMVGSYKGDVKRLGKHKYSNDNSLLVGKYKIA